MAVFIPRRRPSFLLYQFLNVGKSIPNAVQAIRPLDDSQDARCSFLRIPLPKGEGDAKRRVRGEEKNLCTPHPARWREPPSPFGRGIHSEAFCNLDSTPACVVKFGED
jgi:hypothetical protein